MSSTPALASLTHLPALAWLTSQAFAPNRIMAYLSVPVAVLILLPYAIRRQVYESADGKGMVIFGPYRLARDVAILAVLLLPVLALYFWALVTFGPTHASVLWAVGMGLLSIGLAGIGRGSMVMPTGSETPEGDRWQIAGLAQRPGTRLSAAAGTAAPGLSASWHGGCGRCTERPAAGRLQTSRLHRGQGSQVLLAGPCRRCALIKRGDIGATQIVGRS